MTSLSPLRHRHALGMTRREVVQVGYSGLLGLGLPSLFAGRTANAEAKLGQGGTPRAKSVILVFLTGAPSHHDTFDLKPEAPTEIRGEFQPISTSTPGIQICEHLPNLATRSQHYALIRTVSHRDNNHLMSTHHVLTGHKQPGAFFDKVASRDDWPAYSSACDYLRPRRDAIPTGINLPTFLADKALIWPGQHAGFLGPKHDPWQILGDPQAADFRVDSLRLAPGMDVARFGNRQALLEEFNRQQSQLAQSAECRRLSEQQELAFSVLTSSKLAQAFELDREGGQVRDRYGRNTVGQSLLLARRLVEVGVPVVQANIGRVQNWDTHTNIFPSLKDRLLPPLDQGVAALLDDLNSSGMLGETLVVLLGEFGRTPAISTLPGGQKPGRDHWGHCFFALFAGAGVRGGQVLGKSDAIGAYPLTTPYSPDDIGATVYSALGVDPSSEIRDRLNRPVQLNSGRLIEPLFTAATA